MQVNDKVDFLRRAEAYPNEAGPVEAIETHMSWVFLTGEHAYKLKKPVRYPFLDFRTIDARHIDCLEEVRLNRRLAGDVYIGVVPLTGSGGKPRLGGEGEPVDWLVKMRRLPADRMLNQLIRGGTLQAADIEAAAEILSRFYRSQPPVEIAPSEYRRRIGDDIDENRAELTDGAYRLPADRVNRVCERQRDFLDSARARFDERVRNDRIVEGHGDLRPEHVCLIREPVVIDCLEFKRQFRIIDPADEMAYLAMECERLGAPWIKEELFSTYRSVTGDSPDIELVHFYAGFRAALRAKIALWHNRDHGIRDPEKWVRKALSYLTLAEEHTAAFNGGRDATGHSQSRRGHQP